MGLSIDDVARVLVFLLLSRNVCLRICGYLGHPGFRKRGICPPDGTCVHVLLLMPVLAPPSHGSLIGVLMQKHGAEPQRRPRPGAAMLQVRN